MRQTAHLLLATASMAPGACRASMSLIIDAPALRAACITSGRLVSTETGLPRPFTTSSTGRILSISCWTDTGRAPGREDSPPTSMMSAPSSMSWREWETASFASKNFPPSEKESGVTFTTPITRGRSSASSKAPQTSLAGRRGGAVGARGAVGRRRRGSAGAGGGLRLPRRTAGHDVVDLLRVERLPLEQRLRHDLDLLAVLVDQLAR